MRWYKPLPCDNTVKNPLVCDSDNLENYGFDSYSFVYGKLIDNWSKDIFIRARNEEDDGDPDDVLQSHLMIPIFSLRLIKVLNDNDIKGIQYLPIKVLRPNNEQLDGFSIANFLNFIEALDLDKSAYNMVKDDFPNPNVRGKIAGITKFVLKEKKLFGFDIIRLRNHKQSFFVSKRFKDLFEKNKFTGYSFKEIQLT